MGFIMEFLYVFIILTWSFSRGTFLIENISRLPHVKYIRMIEWRRLESFHKWTDYDLPRRVQESSGGLEQILSGITFCEVSVSEALAPLENDWMPNLLSLNVCFKNTCLCQFILSSVGFLVDMSCKGLLIVMQESQPKWA